MTAQERDELIQMMFDDDMMLLKAKGADYAGDIDCLANLREYGSFGILVRMSDKFHRLKTLIAGQKAPHVSDEPLKDTLRDIRNYSFLLQIFINHLKE